MPAPDNCPHCGADLPRNAKACPECGSDEETGWSNDAHASGLDIPDDEFDYDKFVKQEFGARSEMKPRGMHWFWWLIGILLVVGFLLMSLRQVF